MSNYKSEEERKLAEFEAQDSTKSAHNLKYYEDGIWVKKIKIKSIVDNSNHPITDPNKFIFASGYKPEMCFEINFEFEASDFDTKEIVVKESKTILFDNWWWSDWQNKTGFKGVQFNKNYSPAYNLMSMLFSVNELLKMKEDKRCPMPDFTKIHDVELYMLTYCVGEGKDEYAGKPSYKTYRFFAPVVPGEDDVLANKFLTKPPKDYDGKYYKLYKDSKKDNSKTDELSTTDESDLPFSLG